jgi:hypothetical protein
VGVDSQQLQRLIDAVQAGSGTGGTVTIASGQSLSPAFDAGAGRLAALVMPAAWTAAAITFQGSADGSTYADLYDDQGNEATVQAAASRAIALDVLAPLVGAFRYLKVRSGTGGAPVNQAAARAIGYALRGA